MALDYITIKKMKQR